MLYQLASDNMESNTLDSINYSITAIREIGNNENIDINLYIDLLNKSLLLLFKQHNIIFNEDQLSMLLANVLAGVDIISVEVHKGKYQEAYQTNNIYDAIFYLRLAIILQKDNYPLDLSEYIPLLQNLACHYHTLSKEAIKESNVLKGIEYYNLADETFQQALTCLLENHVNNLGLKVEYAQFLITNEKYQEAYKYLEEIILITDDNSELNYSLLEKNAICDKLQNLLEERDDGKITIKASHLAYYLIITNYSKFKQESLIEQSIFLDKFIAIIEQDQWYISYRLLSYAYSYMGNDDKAAETLELAKAMKISVEPALQTSEIGDLPKRIEAQEVNKNINEDEELSEDDAQEISAIINLLLDDQEISSSSTSSSQTSQISEDQILESIDNLKDFIGEKELSQNPGFYQYIFNSLSNNRFAGAAKEIIHLTNNLREYLLDLMESDHIYRDFGIDNEEKVTSIYEQLGYLLGFMASDQRIFSFVPRYPGFNPDDYSGGGGSGSSNEGNGYNVNQVNVNNIDFSSLFVGLNSTNSEVDH